ncbi:MAG: hypothetical protein CMM50_05040 [Rhodospirillaceae bacterium]|nr:hypothetical protein [Rhodospirillaceae bacterium]
MTNKQTLSRLTLGTAACAVVALAAGGQALAQERGDYPYHDPESRYDYHLDSDPGYYTGPKPGQVYQQAPRYYHPWTNDDAYIVGLGIVAAPGERQDTDRDGMIDNVEASNFAEMQFRILDLDNDGVIGWNEFRKADRRLSDTFYYGDQVLYENARSQVEARFSNYDGPDNDGVITRREFMKQAKAEFDDLDRDRNGQVSLWDYRARMGYDEG